MIKIPLYLSKLFQRLTVTQKSLIWASTWEKESNKILSPLGLPDAPFLRFAPSFNNINKNGRWLKESALSYWLKTHPDNDCLLIDDDAPIDSNLNNFNNLKIIRPNPKTGLTPALIENIEKWLNE